ncbi:hypothetical protein [Cyanobium sp. A2C-AMD]|uniref:hypothetical protein n=1 Tax=Cyanobium sp. A2C-AMD TaxID=2823695 RepID=UPI0020CE2363|nr:hypothetical protein [Cyanobium sp. A2C-AMD]MCP9877991.1 hypothetical protein [Cyanobium sp. A2C-AMD]
MSDSIRDDDYTSDDDYASDDDYVGGGSSGQPSTGSSSSGSSSSPSDDDYDDDYKGTGDDDDYRPSGALGFVDDDYVRKLLNDDDYIAGTRIKRNDADDDYSGLMSSGSRLFEGTNRADDIIGGGREVDLMVGRGQDDNFILGNAPSAFYTRDRADGLTSFALIKDFSKRQGDTVFLNGRRSDYGLSRMNVDGVKGLGLMLEGKGSRPDNLIALIQGRLANGLSLGDSSSFEFFG